MRWVFYILLFFSFTASAQFIATAGGPSTQGSDTATELILSTDFSNATYWSEAANVTSTGESTFSCSNTGGMSDADDICTIGNIYDAHIAGNLTAESFEFRANDLFKTITPGDFDESFEFTAGTVSSNLYLRIDGGAATITFTTLSVKLSTTADWVSPTSKEDDQWTDAAKIYDGDLATFGWSSTNSQHVTLLIDAISCSKVRIYAGKAAGGEADLDIDVYYSAGWHSIHTGALTEDAWEEIAVGSTQTITKARITMGGGIESQVMEFEFYKVL